MSVLGQILNERRNAKKNAAVGAQLQQLMGTHAEPGVQMQIGGDDALITHVGGKEATGILARPVDERMEALAIGAATIPGFAEKSFTMMQSAIRNRQQDAIRADEFNRSLFQDQEQFTVQEQQDQQQFLQKQAILDAQHVMKKEKYQLDMAAAMRKTTLDGLTMDKALQDLTNLPAAAEKRLSEITSDWSHNAAQLAEWDDSFAINSPVMAIGMAKLDYNRKTAKTDKELAASVWWAREQQHQNRILTEQAGASQSAGEVARQQRRFILPTMNAKQIRNEMAANQTQLSRERSLFISQWSSQAKGVEARLPADFSAQREKVVQSTGGGTLVPMGAPAPEGMELTEVKGFN